MIWESDHEQTLPTHPLLGSFSNHMSSRETIVEELKVLPPLELAQAADFIHRLRTISRSERQAILERTFGSLTEEEAAKMERAIEEGFEQIDERDW